MTPRSQRFIVALLLTAVSTAPLTSAVAQVVMGGEEVNRVLVVRNVQDRSDGSVTGVLVNKSEQPISQIRLLIRHTFLWNHERKPKDPEDNPARGVYYELDASIQPSGAVPFLYRPDPSLPRRDDGRFQTIVQVVSFNALVLPGEWTASEGEPAIEGETSTQGE